MKEYLYEGKNEEELILKMLNKRGNSRIIKKEKSNN